MVTKEANGAPQNGGKSKTNQTIMEAADKPSKKKTSDYARWKQHAKADGQARSHKHRSEKIKGVHVPVSYTHLTLPTKA